ncbi:transporter substrate-binding domain-containing protein [Mycobacterium sp. SMC-4]|uniref:transporter substrate-binding domain-containing protein n=1 Tax=Mycobacterium sp. SMC-4 TaxID=2857059 RepID=UPI003CFCA828
MAKARWRGLITVVWMVAAMVTAVGLAGPAGAQPQTVRVAVEPVAPFVLERDGVWTGFTVEVWDAIADRQGWTTEWIEVPSLADELAALAAGQADVAAGGISVTAERREDFDFSQPILDAGMQILVPVLDPVPSSPGLREFLQLVFSGTMVAWLGAALVITILPAHLLWLIERRHAEPAVSRAYFPGIIQAFGWGLGGLAAAGDTSPRHWIARAMSLAWAFVGIIFVAFYTANLTAALTVEKLDAQIKGPGDLYGKSVCTVEQTTSSTYLNRLGVEPVLRPAVDDCYDGLREDQFDAVVFDAPVLRHYVAHAGNGVAGVTGPVFHEEDYAFALPLGSPLRGPIDQALLEIREDGTYDLIKEKWFGDDQDSEVGDAK